MCPDVVRTEYTLVDINDEGYMSLMDESGEMREDLKQPEEGDEYRTLIDKYRNEGKDTVMVTIVAALGIEGLLLELFFTEIIFYKFFEQVFVVSRLNKQLSNFFCNCVFVFLC